MGAPIHILGIEDASSGGFACFRESHTHGVFVISHGSVNLKDRWPRFSIVFMQNVFFCMK